MLGCLFGKCSSEKYIVNQVSKNQQTSNGTITLRPLVNDGTTEVSQPQNRPTSITEQQTNLTELSHNNNKPNGDIKIKSKEVIKIPAPQLPQQEVKEQEILETISKTETISSSTTIKTSTSNASTVTEVETNPIQTAQHNNSVSKLDPEATSIESEINNLNGSTETIAAVETPQQNNSVLKPSQSKLTSVKNDTDKLNGTTETVAEFETKHIENLQQNISVSKSLQSELSSVQNDTNTLNGSIETVTGTETKHIESSQGSTLVTKPPQSELSSAENNTNTLNGSTEAITVEENKRINASQLNTTISQSLQEESISVENNSNISNGFAETITEEDIKSNDVQTTPNTKLRKQQVGDKETEGKLKSKAPKPPQQKVDKVETLDLISQSQPISLPEESSSISAATTEKIVEEKPQVRSKIEETAPTNESASTSEKAKDEEEISTPSERRSGVIPVPVNYDKIKSKLPNYPKTQDDEALIKAAIQQNDFLSKIISKRRLDDVVNAMYNKEISSKETIIKQGEKGSHMYISAKGKFQGLIKNKVVSEFNDVRVFGELAILYNAKRLATIKAVTPGRIWVLDHSVYQQIVVRDNIKEQDEIMEFLMNNEKLRVVGKNALREVANLLQSEFFTAGTQIVRQGDKGYKFFIIRAGTVTITKDGEGVVGNYKKGDCFGELALLNEDCRQATVTADAPGVECLTLTRKEFHAHFGELDNWNDIRSRPQDSLGGGTTEYDDIDLRDLKIIKTLGVGGFGRVELVQHKKKSELVFALKYLKKIDIVMQHQQEHVYNEKNIQNACTTPFIVRLYRTYKDNKYIYLLMESCLGGDLWSLLQKQRIRRFEEKEARFIAACVVQSFEYLHSRGIIYRDLKPENLLIAANGYIKLTDFGFAKKISSRGKTSTFAGTPEYVAPEIVLNRGHDRSVDYWALGVFIFELLTGRTPFRTDDTSHMKTYTKILNGIDNIQFPSYINLKARHLIEKLCRPVPSERLGMQKGGIEDVKNHKWFLGFDWQKFAKCEMSPPFKPKLKSNIDTQYFDQFKKDTDVPPDDFSGWDNLF